MNSWKRAIISQHDAEEKAKLEYLTPKKREIWRNFFQTLTQKKWLEKFLLTLNKPDASQKDATNTYDEMIDGIKSKIGYLFFWQLP